MKIKMSLFYVFCILWGLMLPHSNECATSFLLNLEGAVTEKNTEEAKHILKEARENDVVIVRINSSSGTLHEALNIARELYAFKERTQGRVIVFIDGTSLGPSALIPFVADDIYIALFTTWGDILLGNENASPPNVLKSQVLGLINNNENLRNLAKEMIEPSNGKEKRVVSQREIISQGFAKKSLPFEEFAQEFHLQQEFKKLSPLSPVTSFETKMAKILKENPEKIKRIGFMEIIDHSSTISESTWLYVKSALAFYKKNKPAFIILRLDTPGGEVYAAQKIASALQEFDTQEGVPIIAYIDNWAISAGALIAYSCRFIITTKDGSMGAAEPVILGEGGKMETASEKVNSALRAEFANRARFFDRNPDIAEAMVDKDVILVVRDGVIRTLPREEDIRRTGLNPDIVINPKGKLLTLNAKQMIDFGVADLMVLPEKMEQITEEEEREGKWLFSKMLLSKAPFFDKIQDASVVKYKMDRKTRFFVFLASPLVSSLLMLGLILGFYMEMSTPGFGFPGAIALTCLFLIIISNLSLEIASWLEVIFVLGGALMIILEVATLHSGGILGLIGGIFTLIGILGIMLPGIENVSYELDTGTMNAAGESLIERISWLLGTFFVAALIMVFLGRFMTPRIAAMSRLVLKGGEQEAARGYIAGVEAKDLPPVGAVGIAFTPLRPTGKIMVHDTIYDAVTEGSYIEKEEAIFIEKLDGSVIIAAKKE